MSGGPPPPPRELHDRNSVVGKNITLHQKLFPPPTSSTCYSSCVGFLQIIQHILCHSGLRVTPPNIPNVYSLWQEPNCPHVSCFTVWFYLKLVQLLFLIEWNPSCKCHWHRFAAIIAALCYLPFILRAGLQDIGKMNLLNDPYFCIIFNERPLPPAEHLIFNNKAVAKIYYLRTRGLENQSWCGNVLISTRDKPVECFFLADERKITLNWAHNT